jgi:hypothetical protein
MFECLQKLDKNRYGIMGMFAGEIDNFRLFFED